MTLGIHIIKNPAGTYSFVGTLPECLGELEPATKADVMGGRAIEDSEGYLAVLKFPTFETEALAREHAASKWVEIAL